MWFLLILLIVFCIYLIRELTVTSHDCDTFSARMRDAETELEDMRKQYEHKVLECKELAKRYQTSADAINFYIKAYEGSEKARIELYNKLYGKNEG